MENLVEILNEKKYTVTDSPDHTYAFKLYFDKFGNVTTVTVEVIKSLFDDKFKIIVGEKEDSKYGRSIRKLKQRVALRSGNIEKAIKKLKIVA